MPRVFGYDKDLVAFDLSIQEGLPFIEERALLLSDQKIPKSACKFNLNILLALVLCKLEGVMVHLLVLGIIGELLA